MFLPTFPASNAEKSAFVPWNTTSGLPWSSTTLETVSELTLASGRRIKSETPEMAVWARSSLASVPRLRGYPADNPSGVFFVLKRHRVVELATIRQSLHGEHRNQIGPAHIDPGEQLFILNHVRRIIPCSFCVGENAGLKSQFQVAKNEQLGRVCA